MDLTHIENDFKVSKFLSYVLRHKPEKLGVTLDPNGWVDVDELLAKAAQNGKAISKEQLERVVANNDKKRFAFSEDRTKIRASQGHSVGVELGYSSAVPPEILYHGTADRFLESIKNFGLQKQSRQHVHLSATLETASAVGKRHGRLVVLGIRAAEMQRDGFEFYLSANNVWLTDTVPTKYIEFPCKE